MDNDKQNWGEAYKELATLITTKVPAIKHVDLYYGQEQMVDSDGNWIPFPAPAVFLEFNALDVKDVGNRVQHITMEVGVYLCYETTDDTHRGSIGQARALAFVGLLRDLHAALHCADGQHFSPLSRTGINRVDAPPVWMFYRQAYTTVIVDYGGTLNYQEEDTPPLELTRPAPAPAQDTTPLFRVPVA